MPSAVVVARDPRTHSHGHTYPRWSQRTVSQFTYWALGNRCGPTILPSGIIVPSSSQFRARAGAGSEDDGARGSNLGWGEGGALTSQAVAVGWALACRRPLSAWTSWSGAQPVRVGGKRARARCGGGGLVGLGGKLGHLSWAGSRRYGAGHTRP